MASNIEKETIILKGFATKSEIRVLMNNCGFYKASEVFKKANDLNAPDVYKDNRYVSVKNVLKVLGIRAADIFQYAEFERQQKKDG